jgi:uncharacterized protein (DUF58 family)
MPSPRLLVSFALVTLLLAVASAAPGLAAVALGLDLLLLGGLLFDWLAASRARLVAERRWPPLLVQGAAAEVEVAFRSETPLVIDARETLHPGLATGPLRARLVLPPGTLTWRYALVPRRRGSHDLGPLTVRVLGPLGLAWSQRQLIAAVPLRVYPQVRWEGDVGKLLSLARRHELGQSPQRDQGLGSEPYALRDHRPGDPPTRIHWKATARHGRLISREDAWERGTRLVILLDAGRAMMSEDRGRTKLDHALAAALALARVAAARGDRVTLLAFSDRVERLVRLRGGARGVARAYGALFDVEARLAEPAYDLAAEAASSSETRRATVVLLTSVVDLAAAELLRDALLALRRHRVLLVNLEDPDLVRLALASPETPEAAFAKAAALEIQLANRRLGRRLRSQGVRVVGASADRLAWETLQVYLRSARPGGGPAGPGTRRVAVAPA